MDTTPHLAAELKDMKARLRYVVMQDLTSHVFDPSCLSDDVEIELLTSNFIF